MKSLTWLAVHSFLLYQDERGPVEIPIMTGQHIDTYDSELAERRERQERCRIATLASIFASREVRSQVTDTADSE